MHGHIPVLLQETVDLLSPQQGDVVVDCTFNRGGHSVELAKKIGTTGVLIGFDLDHYALEEGHVRLGQELSTVAPQVILRETNFRHIKNVVSELGLQSVNIILADLGLSSQELDISGRGFTFQKDEPLRMTLSSRGDVLITAHTVVNEWSQETLEQIIRSFSDESFAGRIARHIVEARVSGAIESTQQLADIIYHAVPISYRKKKIHPATKTFQAIRMAVNDEVGALQDLLGSLEEVAKQGSRVGFITFHSVEDRIVKNFFKERKDSWEMKTKKPVAPSREEVVSNPRSRSAKLRVYIKK